MLEFDFCNCQKTDGNQDSQKFACDIEFVNYLNFPNENLLVTYLTLASQTVGMCLSNYDLLKDPPLTSLLIAQSFKECFRGSGDKIQMSEEVSEFYKIVPTILKTPIYNVLSSLMPINFTESFAKEIEKSIVKKKKSLTYKELYEYFTKKNFWIEDKYINKAPIESARTFDLKFQNDNDEAAVMSVYLLPVSIISTLANCGSNPSFHDEDEFDHSLTVAECQKDVEIPKSRSHSSLEHLKFKRTVIDLSLIGKIKSGLGFGDENYEEIILANQNSLRPDFGFYLTNNEITIEPGQAGSMDYIFFPQKVKSYSALIVIRNNGKIENSFVVTGEGVSSNLVFLPQKCNQLKFDVNGLDILRRTDAYEKEFRLANLGEVNTLIRGI